MRKKVYRSWVAALFCLSSFLASGSSWASQGPFGLGVILGEPTGVSAKYQLSPSNALDFGLAWSFSRGTAFHFHADYHFVQAGLIKIGTAPFDLFYGIGPRFKFADDFRFGARIPVGMSFWTPQRAVEFFLELVPILDLAPDTDLSFNGGIGARFYF